MKAEKEKMDMLFSINPAQERLYSKITNLEQTLAVLQTQQLEPFQIKVVETCKAYLEKSKDYLRSPRKHSHLVWELLHRVDENIILLVPEEELLTRAVDVMTSFGMNIREEKVRNVWVGEKGILKEAIDQIHKKQNIEQHRYAVRDALQFVNEHLDRSFWQLSMNTLTSVLSGCLLGLLLLVFWMWRLDAFDKLGDGSLQANFGTLAILGLMGAYLSNLLTRDDFLYVRGAPFWRYFAHNVVSKPIMSAFAAIFIFIVEKSKLIFAITIVPTGNHTAENGASQLISLNVSAGAAPYAYAVLAVVSAFAADKILRNMIDAVLKKLERRAEKTKGSQEEGK